MAAGSIVTDVVPVCLNT